MQHVQSKAPWAAHLCRQRLELHKRYAAQGLVKAAGRLRKPVADFIVRMSGLMNHAHACREQRMSARCPLCSKQPMTACEALNQRVLTSHCASAQQGCTPQAGLLVQRSSPGALVLLQRLEGVRHFARPPQLLSRCINLYGR